MNYCEDNLLKIEKTLNACKSIEPTENTFCLWYEYDCSQAFCYNEFGEWFWSDNLEEVKYCFINISLNLFLSCKYDFYMEDPQENEVVRYKTIDRINYIRRCCSNKDLDFLVLKELENLILKENQVNTYEDMKSFIKACIECIKGLGIECDGYIVKGFSEAIECVIDRQDKYGVIYEYDTAKEYLENDYL